MPSKIELHRSDLEKVYDVIDVAYSHHAARDVMNAALHLARTPRAAPLTSELGAARDRLRELLERELALEL